MNELMKKMLRITLTSCDNSMAAGSKWLMIPVLTIKSKKANLFTGMK